MSLIKRDKKNSQKCRIFKDGVFQMNNLSSVGSYQGQYLQGPGFKPRISHFFTL